MSTFGGFMPEFPDIRVDYFRQISGHRPPLACFLSHIHSDHLAGLDTLKSPFVYCSAATRELLLRLERYGHRLNFAKGILEARKLQYKHLNKLLKVVPLETPTRIELEPGNEIQVTLFDANHCTGAVMILLEDGSKAVLYTGDIRSEPWFVNSLVRNPFLIEYTSGLKKLDCIYLDTSNTRPIKFPTKGEGLKELLLKVSQYPSDTVFHFAAWTFGYEEVWMALSRTLKSPIHVDDYKLNLYQSLRGSPDLPNSQFLPNDGRVLTGYICGNTAQTGFLTNDINARIHSCEKGMQCANVNEKTVWIRPIIARTPSGVEIGEIGIGGGGDDLSRNPELDLENNYMIDQFLGLFSNTEDTAMQRTKHRLLEQIRSSGKILSLDEVGLDRKDKIYSLEELTKGLVKSVSEKKDSGLGQNLSTTGKDSTILPQVITFPYSRHSSYDELCHLVKVFDPKDIYPCTVDEATWNEESSISSLFGRECSARIFRHDEEMRMRHGKRQLQSQHETQYSQITQNTDTFGMLPPSSSLQQRACAEGRPAMPIKKAKPDLSQNSEADHISTSSLGDQQVSPPTSARSIVAVSPGSSSQSLRRKAIREEMNTDLSVSHLEKKPRLYGPGIFPPAQKLVEQSAFTQDPQENINISAASSHRQDEPTSVPRTFWDPADEVFRCTTCSHEVWGTQNGFCTQCDEGPKDIPYFEIEQGKGRPPEVEDGHPSQDDDPVFLDMVVGDVIDYDSSAYDTQDAAEPGEFYEEYLRGSDIDDEEIEELSTIEDMQLTSDVEMTASQQALELEAEINDLVAEDNSEEGESDDQVRDNIDGVEMEEDEASLVMVDKPSGPNSDEMQDSSGPRSQRARDGFGAAKAVGGQNWYNTSLLSITADHTHPEKES